MATKKFSPAQIAAQKLFAERARAGTLGKGKRKANPVKGEKTKVQAVFGSPSKCGGSKHEGKLREISWAWKLNQLWVLRARGRIPTYPTDGICSVGVNP